MNDSISQMGTLLQKMTAETAGSTKFTDDQAANIITMVIPKMISTMPGMAPHGFTTSLETDANGWTIRINRPKK